MSNWSIIESDVLTIILKYGDLQYAIRKSDIYYESYESYGILVTFNKFVYNKFVVNPAGTKPTCYMFDWKDCVFPVATDRDNLLEQLITMLQNGSDTKVQKNGTYVGQEPTLNFIEGSNITITAIDDPTNNKIDITIDASGGGGGLPPDGTYGDVVVSGAGTIWTITDDTSNQQVAVYEDGFIRGTRPRINFYDDGGPVSVTVADDSINNRVDIEITSTGIGTITSVTGTSPISSTGGTTPDISIQQASNTQSGYLSATDWNTFNNKGNGTVTSVGATSPITSSGGATPTISTSMATNKLIGRTTAGTGVMEEISIGTGLSLSGGTLSNSSPFTTPLTTKGDIYTRNASADTRLPVGLDTQVLLADSTTATGLKWGSNTTPPASGYYGAFQDNVTQTAVASNVGYAMILRTVDLSNGISVVTNGTDLTRITFANTGIYNLQFSSQFQNTDNVEHDVTIWLRLNGTDVAGSAGFVQVPKRKAAGAGNEGHVVISWNYVLSVVAGQYYELIWSTTDHTNVTMQFYAAGSPPPAAASVILTITQQSGIMAGTGITAINSLTGAAQTLVVGTSGSDFDISSSGTAHTFNLPTASATNRGALSSADWTTFNNKPISSWHYRKAGRWYIPSNNALAIESINNFINAIRYTAVIIDRDITVTQLGINVVTIAGAGNTCRIGIYSNDPTTTQPLNRLVDTGTLALDATGPKTVTGLAVVLTKGLYWFCYVSNATTGTIAAIANLNIPDVIGTQALNTGPITNYSQTFTYAALPATTGTLTNITAANSVCTYYGY